MFDHMWLIKPFGASSHEMLSWAHTITLISMNFGLIGNCGHDIIRQSLTVIRFEMHVHNTVNHNHRVVNLVVTALFFSGGFDAFENQRSVCIVVSL